MRPIRLEIAGLQSFSNKQIIDFETLGSEGIFGIFGETGSGKSTILDAMILALFDEIPRLKGQTKSIASCLNHECNQIEIKFKFALDKKIFEIYRGYRRRVNKKGEEKFEQINPILKMDGVIIADTVRNFALKIDEYLGVTASDFTKTVILPQGKFSEFLKLKSAEKMEMLEKIFDLEIYGSKMSEKLKLKNTKVKDEVMALENQLKGVGEFSLELMEELKNSLLKNEEKLKNITLDKYRQEKLYDEIETATGILAALDAFEKNDNKDAKKALNILASALKSEIDYVKERILLLLALIQPLETIRTLLSNYDSARLNNTDTIKIIDKILSGELRTLCLPLFEDKTVQQQLALLRPHFYPPVLSIQGYVRDIMNAPEGEFTSWTKACAAYTAGYIKDICFIDSLVSLLSDPDPVVRETSVWALGKIMPQDEIARLIISCLSDPCAPVARMTRFIISGTGKTVF